MRKRYTTKQSGKNEKKNISRGKEKKLDLRLKSKQTSVETLLLFFASKMPHVTSYF